MKRYTRKTLTIFLGLAMGWYVAGLTSTFAADSHGDSEKHVDDSQQATDTDHPAENAHDDHATSNEHSADSAAGHGSADADAAKKLVPKHPQDIAWYPKVIYTIIGLFIVAILAGLIGKSKGIREPGIMASEQDAQQAHGEDEEDLQH